MALVYCKPYHEPRTGEDPGELTNPQCRKSRCPGWISDPELRQRLLDEALDDPQRLLDLYGRPKRKWNALDGWVFVGVSTNERVLRYNCSPEAPCTSLAAELKTRSQRILEDWRS
jgi:hypothetical protein